MIPQICFNRSSGARVATARKSQNSARIQPTKHDHSHALTCRGCTPVRPPENLNDCRKYGTASTITIIGRVKEKADKRYDIRLSKQRATNVSNFLKKLGVRGTYKTVAAGISPENKAISRRVEVTLKWVAKLAVVEAIRDQALSGV